MFKKLNKFVYFRILIILESADRQTIFFLYLLSGVFEVEDDNYDVIFNQKLKCQG